MAHRYINREQSWLEFNARVLSQALDTATPTLERLRFLAIFTTNLDEFFMVRVAGLRKMREEGLVASDSPETIDSNTLLATLRSRTEDLLKQQYACFSEVLDTLQKVNIRIRKVCDLQHDERQFINQYFKNSIFPVLTPLAYDAAHPFPFLTNLSLYMLVQPDLDSIPEGVHSVPRICFVEIPAILPRLIPLPRTNDSKGCDYVCIDDMIAENLDQLFLGLKVKKAGVIRVTRNLDYTLLENEVVDLLKSMTKEMVLRQQQEVVRLEAQQGLPKELIDLVKEKIQIGDEGVFMLPSPLYIPSFTELCNLNFPELKFDSFNPRLPARFELSEDIFALISKDDFIVHHPYESFYTVTEFLNTAAQDPNVLAIKQMLYRTGGDSPILQALIEAAAQGKQVTAVVELKARFDEKNNISWARELERAGVNVVFGFVDLKTHSKATLVVRREGSELKRYAHLSTGNYNSVTARVYTDIGLFTKDPLLCEDAAQLFNLVTGVNIMRYGRLQPGSVGVQFKEMSIAPLQLRATILGLIDREIANAKQLKKALIIAKMNALVDKELIDKLYEASIAGVKIKLIVRGICCLRPQVQGLSENIQVVSVIDRFLEHSRIYYFYADGVEDVFLSSADWMPRNMDRRVEAFFPVKQDASKRRLIDEILATCWSDNIKGRQLTAEGNYIARVIDEQHPACRSQFKFIDLARAAGLQSIPYDKALAHDRGRSKGQRPFKKKEKKRKR